MPLEYPVSINGEDYTVLLSLPVDKGDPFVIIDYDLEPDIIAETFGIDPNEAIVLLDDWLKGLPVFLSKERNLEKFLIQLRKQGLDSLPITKEELGKALSEAVDSVKETGPWDDNEEIFTLYDFFEIVIESYPDYYKLTWDDKIIEMIAEIVYQEGEYELFRILNNLSNDTLYEIIVHRCECRRTSQISVDCNVEAELIVIGSVEDRFIIKGTYSYTDAELENPEWIIDDDMFDGPKNETEEFLEEMGEETDWEFFIQENCRLYDHELDSPPTPDPDGDAAIFINEDFYERFKSYGAERFEEMSQEAIELHGLGESVVALTLRDDVDPDDPDFDETDMDNYE